MKKIMTQFIQSSSDCTHIDCHPLTYSISQCPPLHDASFKILNATNWSVSDFIKEMVPDDGTVYSTGFLADNVAFNIIHRSQQLDDQTQAKLEAYWTEHKTRIDIVGELFISLWDHISRLFSSFFSFFLVDSLEREMGKCIYEYFFPPISQLNCSQEAQSELSSDEYTFCDMFRSYNAENTLQKLHIDCSLLFSENSSPDQKPVQRTFGEYLVEAFNPHTKIFFDLNQSQKTWNMKYKVSYCKQYDNDPVCTTNTLDSSTSYREWLQKSWPSLSEKLPFYINRHLRSTFTQTLASLKEERKWITFPF